MARHLILINPAAGKTNAERLCREAGSFFSSQGLDYRIERTRCAGHASDIAKEAAAAGEETVLYVCGGDGTLHEAVQGLAGSRSCALAPVPTGSGNDFVRTFGQDAAGAFIFAALADGAERRIDLLRVEDTLCLNLVSGGFDAAICALMPRYKRLPFVSGSAAYLLALAHGFFASPGLCCEVEADGEKIAKRDYLFAVAANGRCYGGGFCAAPRASLSDGLLDLVLVPKLPRLKMLGMIGDYRQGKHLDTYDFIHFSRRKSVRLLSSEPLLMNLDGEITSLRNPTISVEPGALRLLLPKVLAGADEPAAALL